MAGLGYQKNKNNTNVKFEQGSKFNEKREDPSAQCQKPEEKEHLDDTWMFIFTFYAQPDLQASF